MSQYSSAVRGIRAPLEFVLGGSERAERVRELQQTLLAALSAATELWIPQEAKRRFSDAAQKIAENGVAPSVLEPIAKRLGPLLDPDYARRALSQETVKIPGVGPKIAQALARKEIHRIEDLLFFLPRSYEDRRDISKIEELQVGHSVCFEGTVTRSGVVPLRNGRSFLQAVVSDGTAAVQLKWFRGIAHFQDRLKPGARVLVAGDVRRYRYAKELHHPELEFLNRDAPLGSLPRIVPTYSHVEGVPPRTMRRIVESTTKYAADLVDAWLPETSARRHGLADLGESLREVHLPSPHLDPELLRERRTPYHLRLVAEELLLLQVGLELRRAQFSRRASRPLAVAHPGVQKAIDALPFKLTSDQERVWREISSDLSRAQPMNRMLIGDVGTGKTVLAILGAVAAHASGGVTAVLAPTEILAEQHFETFRKLAQPLGLNIGLLTGSTPAPQRRSLRRLLALGEIAIVIGTHALLTESFDLPKLAFVVIDEQHRFGVAQRRALGDKGENPHVLLMSATPIPRSLALTVFGDLDHSVLRERPPGRSPVETRVIPPEAARQALDALREALARDEQAYIVYPLVEESEKQDLKDASRGYERLVRALPGVRVGLLHGRLDGRERLQTMQEFAAGRVRVLVSTTVIEVGVDVHNATLLIVQHAERFGLAQLHQLRGRVGRGQLPGRAMLISEPRTEDASRRLAILEASESGFEIAEEDLRIRGAGEWLGTRQAGHLPELRLADLVRHGELLPVARAAARDLLSKDPELRGNPILRTSVEQRWGGRLDFGAVA